MPRVTGVEWKGEAQRKARVYLDGEWWRTLERDVIEGLGLYEGLEVDEGELGPLEERVAEEKAKLFVLRSLSARAQTRAELAKKLEGREVPDEVAAKVLDAVTSYGFIDDAEVGRGHLRHLVERGYGRRRGLAKLREKGVEQELALTLAEEAFPSEEQATAALGALRSRRLSDDPRDKKRALDFLIRRGFSYGEASSALRARLAELQLEDELAEYPGEG